MPDPIKNVPIYGWETLLRMCGLVTVSMLKADRRRPADGQEPVAQYWTGHEYRPLYKLDGVVDLPPLSPGRRRLYEANRTCARCGRRSKLPWEKGRDGKRYCSQCQEPAAQDLWDREQMERRKASSEWAREVLADDSVVLAATRAHQFWREAYAADLHGAVLLDAKVRYAAEITPYAARADGIADTIPRADVVDRLVALAGRRVVTWWPGRGLQDLVADLTQARADREPDERELPQLATVAGDDFGRRYDNWVGKLSGGSYRWHPAVAHNPAPWEPEENVATMRAHLAEMADPGPGPVDTASAS